MIRICHLTSAHPWDDIRIFHRECRSLAKHGYDVSLIAFDAPDDTIENVHVINAGVRHKSRLGRMLIGTRIVASIAMKINADVYHFHDPELIPVAKQLAKRGKKVVYDVHEDVPGQILTKPYLSKKLAKIISVWFKRYETASVKYFSAVVCATPHIAHRFSVIHNIVSDVSNYPLSAEIPSRLPSFENRIPSVCYIGAISEIRGILPLIDAMALCDGVTLELAGSFPDGAFKQKAKASPGWKFVNKHGLIDRKAALRLKEKCFAGIVTFLEAENHINAQPNKIFEYMASGLPVIGSAFPLWQEIIEGNSCGICVNPQKPDEIAQAIMKLWSDKALAERMGQNGFQAVKNKYNWDNEEQKLIDLYKRIENTLH